MKYHKQKLFISSTYRENLKNKSIFSFFFMCYLFFHNFSTENHIWITKRVLWLLKNQNCFNFNHTTLIIIRCLQMSSFTWILVFTPLCVFLHCLYLGSTGTGKTKTTLALAKTLGNLCKIINCSDRLDHEIFSHFLNGICQSKIWGLFTKFNRITRKTLSVISTLLFSMKWALLENKSEFNVIINKNNKISVLILYCYKYLRDLYNVTNSDDFWFSVEKTI